MTQCGPCTSNPCSTIQIIAGYQKVYTWNLLTDAGLPYDLSNAGQIQVIHPGAAGVPVIESLATETTTGTTNITTGTANQITGIASMVGIEPGVPVAGSGIPAGAYVVSVLGSTATISQNATIAASGVTLTFGNTNVIIPGATGSGQIQVTIPAGDSALLAVNPNEQQFQDLQIAVNNGSAGTDGFLYKATLNILAPTYGVVT